MRTLARSFATTLGAAALIHLFALGPPALFSAEPEGSASGGISGASQARAESTPEVNATGYTSARVCGGCHTDIYNSWKNSLHALALTDPIFDTAYMQAIKEAGEGARRFCLRCHAPMTMMNGDYELKQGVSREGVSCDFCHTVTAVHLDGRDKPYSSEPGLVKRGIIKMAASPAHEVAYSELHGTSEFCGGCHNLLGPGGILIMGTYDEWKSGPYPSEGIQCQDCHMALSAGKVVRQELMKTGPEIHLHDLIHDTDQLRSALSLQIVGAKRGPHGLDVEVSIENVGSGHMVPTGLPTREVVLSVQAESGGKTRTAERRYRKVLADEKGHLLGSSDVETLLRGAKIVSDNRFAPRELRTELFRLAVPETGAVKVTATLSYQYSPVIVHEQRLDIKLGQVERHVQ